MIREKKHRLPLVAYRGFQVVSFTACIKLRTPFFTTPELFDNFKEMLLRGLREYECASDIYLFMPDRTHIICRGQSETADTWRAMKAFKQYSGFWLAANRPSHRWQKDFYDHILRNDAAIEKHIWYILNNPVRAGLVDYWKDYPFKGSTLYNLDDWD